MAVTIEVLVGGQHDRRDATSDEAFSRAYAEMYDRLVVLCRRLLAGQGDAEAMAQETFSRAWLAWDQYDPRRPLWPWLSTIARRLCIDQARHRGRRQSRPEFDRTAVLLEPGPEELLERAAEHASALRALDRLRPEHRRLINLRDLDGWSYEDIASFEGTTVESVRGHLRRARIALRSAYDRVVEGAPAVGALGLLRGLRQRLSDAATRSATFGPQGMWSADRLGEALVTAVAVLAVSAGPGLSSASSEPGTQSPESAAPEPMVVTASPGVAGMGVSGAEEARVLDNPSALADGPSASPGSDGDAGRADPSAGAPDDGDSASPLPFGDEPGVPAPPAPAPPPDGGEEPEDATIVSFTAANAPDGDGDDGGVQANGGGDGDDDDDPAQTVFASGVVDNGCQFPPCYALFRSNDAGATWSRLPGLGFTGGEVLVPPNFPVDHRIFVSGADALKVSDDGGASFRDAAPIGGDAVMSPAFSDGDPRIFLGDNGGWVYDAATGSVTPIGLAPPPPGTAYALALAPDFPADDRIFVGATAPGPSGPKTAAVFTCRGGQCGGPVTLGDVIGIPRLEAFAAGSGEVEVMAWRGARLYRSADGGSAFERLRTPSSAAVTDVGVDRRGRMLVAQWSMVEGGTSAGGLFTSGDGGHTWAALGKGAGLNAGVLAVTVLDDGRILAARAPHTGGGSLCSVDGGASWTARCA